MGNVPGYIVISAFALAAVGVLLMTYVQTRIIRGKGIRHFGERGFVNVYWRDRTTIERWCFFVGLSLLLLPFVAFGLLSLSHAAV
jgi:hypothetical protein